MNKILKKNDLKTKLEVAEKKIEDLTQKEIEMKNKAQENTKQFEGLQRLVTVLVKQVNALGNSNKNELIELVKEAKEVNEKNEKEMQSILQEMKKQYKMI